MPLLMLCRTSLPEDSSVHNLIHDMTSVKTAATMDPALLLQLPAELRLNFYEFILPTDVVRGFAIHCKPGRYTLRSPALKEVETVARHNTNFAKCFRDVRKAVTATFLPLSLGTIGTCDPPETVRTFLNMLKTCRTIREELLALLLRPEVFMRAWVPLACWYGLENRFFARRIQFLKMTDELKGTASIQERWITQLLCLYPDLKALSLSGFHTHKDDSTWGTPFKLEDLRIIKFTVDNSSMKYVAVDTYTQRCEARRPANDCYGNLLFTTADAPFEVDFAQLIEIKVEEELASAISRPIKRIKLCKHRLMSQK